MCKFCVIISFKLLLVNTKEHDGWIPWERHCFLRNHHVELTHWKRLWCWEGLGAGGKGDDRGWDGWMQSLTWWTWVWVNSRSWWWTGRPGVLRFMGSQRVGHNWTTELNWRNHQTVFQVVVHFAFPPAMTESSCCSTLSAFGVVSVLSDFFSFITCPGISGNLQAHLQQPPLHSLPYFFLCHMCTFLAAPSIYEWYSILVVEKKKIFFKNSIFTSYCLDICIFHLWWVCLKIHDSDIK